MAKPEPIPNLDAQTPLIEAARAVITIRLGEVRRFEERLPQGLSPDDVHDLRVASRRLRAALALFDRRRHLRRAANAVRALGEVLGEVRELQVQQAWLADAAKQASERDRPSLWALKQEREGKLQKRFERLHSALGVWRDSGVATVEEALGALELGGRFDGNRVRRRLGAGIRTVKRRVRRALDSADVQSAHRLRIAAKKLRYTAELAAPAFPEALGALLDELAPLQETLGRLHDADVHIPVVERFLVRADAAAQPGALALLRGEMAKREQLGAALADTLARLRSERVLERVRDALD